MAGVEGRGSASFDDGMRAWLEANVDSTESVRASTAEFVGGQLSVLRGPLVGQEVRVLEVDHRKGTALAAMGAGPKAPA